jgi:hypothetical protein
MPTFRVRNLSVTLDAVEKAAAADIDQLCLNQTRYCLKPSILNCEGGVSVCLLPSEPICVGLTEFLTCVKFTKIPVTCLRLSCGLSCNPLSGGCGMAWSTLPDTLDPLTPLIKTIEDFDILKVLEIQLNDAMKAIQDRGIELEKQFRPRSLADAEAVEKELEAALAELKEMKKDLK